MSNQYYTEEELYEMEREYRREEEQREADKHLDEMAYDDGPDYMEDMDPSEYVGSDDDVRCDWYDDVQEWE